MPNCHICHNFHNKKCLIGTHNPKVISIHVPIRSSNIVSQPKYNKGARGQFFNLYGFIHEKVNMELLEDMHNLVKSDVLSGQVPATTHQEILIILHRDKCIREDTSYIPLISIHLMRNGNIVGI